MKFGITPMCMKFVEKIAKLVTTNWPNKCLQWLMDNVDSLDHSKEDSQVSPWKCIKGIDYTHIPIFYKSTSNHK